MLVRLGFSVFHENEVYDLLGIQNPPNLSDDKLVQLLHRSHNRAAEGFFLSIIQIQVCRRGEVEQEE